MYETFEAFKADAVLCGIRYYGDKSLDPVKTDAAYRIYLNAAGGTKLSDADGNEVDFNVTIVGRLALRAEDGMWEPSNEAFPSIDEILRENLKTLNEDDAGGSILNSNNWSLLANDAWLLGGIHAGTEFHFASPLRWENLWDARRGRPTVTAREVIGISSFGYEILRPYPNMEAVAICADAMQAAGATLPSYMNSVLKYQTEEAMRKFFETIPSGARE